MATRAAIGIGIGIDLRLSDTAILITGEGIAATKHPAIILAKRRCLGSPMPPPRGRWAAQL
ncbi:hypothetical protein [Lysobacter sp. MMG2]|uniref:hypothetical protein n=1 Tax=Lysobacter sp. MMG2 TaxID=2801338 RepID=UPI001C232748|nr:hypothetical protein [Lysobacter sp. MMG2]